MPEMGQEGTNRKTYRPGQHKCPRRRLLQKLVLRYRQELTHRLARRTVAFPVLRADRGVTYSHHSHTRLRTAILILLGQPRC